MSDCTVAVFYFPNYHVDPRNELSHGPGWTEWELVKRAEPRFPGHRQPRIPVWGYEDESIPENMAKKVTAAADHGIDVFLFDWYYYNDGPFHPFQTGFIYRKGENTLFVAANEGTLIVNKVLDENGNDIIKEMKVGERFFTGMEHLESAKQFKAVYTPSGLKDKYISN